MGEPVSVMGRLRLRIVGGGAATSRAAAARAMIAQESGVGFDDGQ
jgi:hypothetical protein